MQDERLLIIHTKTVPPPHPHGALTHQAPAANAAHGVPGPSAVQGVLHPRGTHGDPQELPGHGQVPGKLPGSWESPDFAASLTKHTALAPTRCHPHTGGHRVTPHRGSPRDKRGPWAVSTQAAPATMHWDGDSARAGWGHCGAPSPSRFSHPCLGDPGAPCCPPQGCPPHMGHPSHHLTAMGDAAPPYGAPQKAPPGLAPSTQGTPGPSPPTWCCLGLVHPPRRAPRAAPLPWGAALLPPQGTQFCSPLGLLLFISRGTVPTSLPQGLSPAPARLPGG